MYIGEISMEPQLRKYCPECKSQNTVRFGKYITRQGKRQRFRCNNCARVFTEPIGE